MSDQQRPETTREEIERTGRTEEAVPQAKSGDAGFGTPGTPAERVPDGHENDFA